MSLCHRFVRRRSFFVVDKLHSDVVVGLIVGQSVDALLIVRCSHASHFAYGCCFLLNHVNNQVRHIIAAFLGNQQQAFQFEHLLQ